MRVVVVEAIGSFGSARAPEGTDIPTLRVGSKKEKGTDTLWPFLKDANLYFRVVMRQLNLRFRTLASVLW